MRRSTRRIGETDRRERTLAPGRRRRRRRRRSQRTGHRCLPRPGGHAHGAPRSARLGRWHRGQRAVRRGHGEHLQLRSPHVPHHPGDRGARPVPARVALRRRRAGTGEHGLVEPRSGVGARTTTSTPPSIRWRRRSPARSTATAATCAPRGLQCRWSWQPRRSRHRRAASPGWRCADGCRASPTALRWSRRSAADVLRSYFNVDAISGASRGDRTDGVGDLTGVPRHRPRRAAAGDAPRRQGGPPRSAARVR